MGYIFSTWNKYIYKKENIALYSLITLFQMSDTVCIILQSFLSYILYFLETCYSILIKDDHGKFEHNVLRSFFI